MGNLFLPSLLKLHLKFNHIYGSAYSFQAIYAPKLHRVSTNFAVPCLEGQWYLFDVDSGSNLDNQCFNNYIGAGTEKSLVQGITYDRTMHGSFGILYEMEEDDDAQVGGQFSVSHVHFKQFQHCYKLDRINVSCDCSAKHIRRTGKFVCGWK